MFDNKIYGFVTIGSKGQLVIPAEAREAFGLNPGDHLFVVGSEKKGVLVLLPEGNAVEFVNKINSKIEDFEAARKAGPQKSE
jgi:AbrB family looped-hinge helix DNA binding protein